MKINKKYDILKACGKDSTKYVIQNPLFVKKGDKSYLVATDCHKLVRIEVESEESDKPALLSANGLEIARKSTKKDQDIYIQINEDKAIYANGSSYKHKEGTYPNWEQVIPSKDTNNHFRCKINPYLLNDTAKALGVGKDEGITLHFSDDPLKPVLIEHDHNIAVVAPMT